MTQQYTKKEIVTAPSSSSTPVRLEYKIKNNQDDILRKDCELLVIACDPRNLHNICDYTPTELNIFDKLVNFTFHTSLLKIKVPVSQKPEHAVVFAPEPLEQMAGSVYGFRNESAKQFGLDAANTKMTHNLVTVYQLLGPTNPVWPSDKFQNILKQQLQTIDWWPFSDDYEILKTVTTPYFNHFSADDLKDGLPWQFLNIQGQHKTLYVHASTCFESVWDCWAYAQLMLDSMQNKQQVLPTTLDAPIVILGAGVSGLLFAVRLKRLGYTNIEILESTDRNGGKTHTIIEDGPFPIDSTEKTVCELGTCYLSPSYAPMIKDLARFFEKNKQIDFTEGKKTFRGIVTEGEFPPSLPVAPVIDYAEYVILKAEELLKIPRKYGFLISIKLAYALIKYAYLHRQIMGRQKPMPPEPPTSFLQKHSSKTFLEFLEYHNLQALIGMLQYGYEVQGYGVLKNISAYYGLVWITPAVTNTILFDSLKWEHKPVVTAWTNGWGDLWKQIVQKEDFSITYSVETTSIKRENS